MEPRAKEPKEGKAQTIPRFGVQAQRKFCEERGSFQKGANPKEMLVGSPREHASTATKWGITPKIIPSLKQGKEALR
jgi:hypothetical protein